MSLPKTCPIKSWHAVAILWVIAQTFLVGLLFGLVVCGCQQIPLAAENLQDSFRSSRKSKTDNWTPVFLRQADIIGDMSADHPDIDFSVIWEPCGQENAFYFPESHTIHLCTELAADPGMAVFAAAHEFGHAIAMQLFDDDGEQSADALAALAMLDHGYQDDLVAAGLYFAHGSPYHIPGDTHPSSGFRAWYLMCMEEGWEHNTQNSGRFARGSSACSMLYSGQDILWHMRLRLGRARNK